MKDIYHKSRIATTEVAPSPFLAPYIRCYTYREFDTQGLDLVKPWHASPESAMVFFFKALPLQLVHPETGAVLKKGQRQDLVGSSTQYNGEMTFRGAYAFFEINFKVNGLHKILALPAQNLINKIVDTDSVLGVTFNSIYERLYEAKGLTQMAAVADAYLSLVLAKQKGAGRQDAITAIANTILKRKGFVDIDFLACEANMCLRTFERHFIEEVGMPVKLFCCVTRFNHALALKLQYPERTWTAIASSCGYYDQMHLIREFKKFSGSPPCHFLQQTPLTEEHFLSRIDI